MEGEMRGAGRGRGRSETLPRSIGVARYKCRALLYMYWKSLKKKVATGAQVPQEETIETTTLAFMSLIKSHSHYG